MARGLKLDNIGLVKMRELPTHLFNRMVVHLTPMAGCMFVEAVIYFLNSFFEAQLDEREQEKMEVTPGVSGSRNVIPLVTKPLVKKHEKIVVEQLADIKEEMED